MSQYQELREKEANLGKNQRDIEADANKIDYLRRELEQAEQDRRQMEETHNMLLSNDVFKKQKNGENSYQDI